MNDFFLRKRIHRFFGNGEVEELGDDIIRESLLMIRLDDHDFIQAVCTPYQIEEFVIGFLRTRGLIDSLEDIDSLDVSGNTASVIRTSPLRGSLPQLGVLETTGTRNVSMEGFVCKRERLSAGRAFSSEVLMKGMEELSRMPLYVKSGGTHCAILFSRQGNALASAEDIGRHNAVDKTIGGGMRKNVVFSDTWLAVSGRLPADMVLKPLLVGIPLIASVSAPTSGGVELGERSGLTVVGFVRGGRLNCYSHPERIIA
jgi:FdhD protein